jgi:hypothetical protein
MKRRARDCGRQRQREHCGHHDSARFHQCTYKTGMVEIKTVSHAHSCERCVLPFSIEPTGILSALET